EEDEMRIADRQGGGIGEGTGRDVEVPGIARLGERNLPPVRADPPHVDTHPLPAGAPALQAAAARGKHDFVGPAFLEQQPGGAARGVAARLRLAAVAVPEAQARRNACIRRGLDGDELVGTDADLRVAYPGDLVSRWLE